MINCNNFSELFNIWTLADIKTSTVRIKKELIASYRRYLKKKEIKVLSQANRHKLTSNSVQNVNLPFH